MRRTDLLTFLADEIVARKQEGRPLKVGIDGRSGAGKSTLRDELVLAIGQKGFEVLSASVDDFHNPRERRYKQGEYSPRGYYEDAYDYESVVSGLLEPLAGTTFPVLCHQVSFDQRTNLPLSPPPVPAGANIILLFEGIFVFRGRLNGYWDYRILLDIDTQTSLRRAVARDTGILGTADMLGRRLAARYDPAWQIYADDENPEGKADVVIDNRDAAIPKILKRA
ncbi:MAG TPA: hypothetical protein VGQ49_09295 [Bryobacteraceae bacterium]|nr:hypothetical protein [Bryobacteraceae bacterium]